jgi:small-conductance mechanosensitive channel
MQEFLGRSILHYGEVNITVGNLIFALGVFVVAWVLSQVFSFAWHKYAARRRIDTGREYAVQTLFKYFLYIFTFFLAMQALGVQLNVIWVSAAALLVGLGFGLQHIFNDIVSGLIILVEGTVEVDDVVIVDGIVGIVRKIGLRTSHVETREKVVIIVPNSKLVSENVVNWSHNKSSTRFVIEVGVSYPMDPRKVETILLRAAKEHPEIEDNPPPQVQFRDFGDSALEFHLHFYTLNFWSSERIKSDVRFSINALFREHGIDIPFPQRDLWLRNPEALREND